MKGLTELLVMVVSNTSRRSGEEEKVSIARTNACTQFTVKTSLNLEPYLGSPHVVTAFE